MAAGETARLIASLELLDKFTPGMAKALGSVGKLESRLNKIGGIASRGMATAAGNIQRLGAVAVVGIGAAVGSGIALLSELETATTSVDGAIKQMGMTGQVTGAQVAGWAAQIEDSVGAAFDEKPITAATAVLIRFGKLAPANLQRGMRVMTDLAAKTGSVESAATLLAKALADPEKAAGKLARSGVVLTKAQQEQIKTMVKAGDAAGAQEYLLRRLEQTTKGAALASAGPYKRALNELADAGEHARMGLAEGFLPLITKVASKLRTALVDPTVMAGIREFGQTLAGAFDSILSIGEKLPWSTIADSLKIAGASAKTLLGAFTAMPPWVQTAVITGWGLNKLTGGALSGIVGELGKGLIKGVLGMNAGVVNINAAVVNGAGGLPGTVTKGTGVAGALAAGLTAGAVIAVGAVALDQYGKISDQSTTLATQAAEFVKVATLDELKSGRQALIDGAKELADQSRYNPLAAASFEGMQKALVVLDAAIAAGGLGGSSGGGTWGKPTPPGGLVATPDRGSGGVLERAIAKGLHPTLTGIDATMRRNAAVQASIARVQAVATVAAYRDGADRIVRAIQAIVMPDVRVSFTARDQLLNENKRDAYGPTTKIGGAVRPVGRGALP